MVQTRNKRSGMAQSKLHCFTKYLIQLKTRRTSHSNAQTIFAADDARSISNFLTHLKGSVSQNNHVYIDMPQQPKKRKLTTARSILKQFTALSPSRTDVSTDTDVQIFVDQGKRRALAPELSRLRAIKSLAEQKVMRLAGDLSGRAHAKVSRFNTFTIFPVD